MYLKKLEIFGFKSFQQKTEIKFSGELTGIVGPNGCGKTNIVDAIRWSLGEQKSSTLRSEKMENIIFNGTANKKPMGMAEVSLTISNDKGILPSEYTEVTISRRIFRSGESEYLLNKNLCRLKDITNLFMDTGMGANAYSVIELKMVEAILSNKADELRTLFEEAAGVNKYKLRRRLTLKRLDEVKNDLTRVNDIVAEVERKVNSLERQAKRADKFNKLFTTQKELELDLSEREIALWTLQRENLKIHRGELHKQKVDLESNIARLNDEIGEIRVKLTAIESSLQNKRNEITKQTELLHQTQEKLSVNKERKVLLESNIARYQKELSDAETELKQNQEFIREGKSNIEKLDDLIIQKQEERKINEVNTSKAKSLLEESRSKLRVFDENYFLLIKELSSKENEINNLEKNLSEFNESIAKLNKEIEKSTASVARMVGFIESLQEEKADVEKRLSESEQLYVQKTKAKEELDRKIKNLTEKELEEKSVINALKEKINFLRTVIDNLEGISKGAKSLMENKGWTAKEKNLLVNIGSAPDEYRFAIEAALKNNLNNVLIESIEEVLKGIEFLKENNYGKASFYVFGEKEQSEKNIWQKLQGFFKNRSNKKLEKENGFLHWASSLVVCEEKWKNFFSRLLNDYAVVKDIKTAIALLKKYKNINFVTLNGDIIYSNGIIEAGSEPKLDDTIFGRKQLLEQLLTELPVKEKELSLLHKKITELQSESDSIDLRVISEQGRILVNDLANVEKQINQIEFEKKKTNDEIEKASQEMQTIAMNTNQLNKQLDESRENLSLLLIKKEKADEEKNVLNNNVSACEDELNKATTLLNESTLELERLNGEKKNIINAIERAVHSIDNIEKLIANKKNGIIETESEIELITKNVIQFEEELTSLNKYKSKLVAGLSEIEADYQSVKREVTSREISVEQARKEKDEINNELYSTDLKINEFQLRTENLRQRILDEYGITLELKTFDDLETFDFTVRTQEVNSIKQQVKNLGAVNQGAYAEYEEEKSRYDFLIGQRNDLLNSEKDLVKTIEEINATAQNLFMTTFEQIRENFINTFRKLFNPGDEADLKLENSVDPLEGKIEVIAKPKGKKPTTIELLSGGEKTLTAIALLFSIYLVKPSPFCILDEIDAPLDDANVDRFTNILKEFGKNTQFIIVTHNKRTMEACDTLYGVTMQEEGISKLVSVKFGTELNVVN